MKKISVIGATLLGAAVLCAAPISLHQSQDKGLSLSVDKAQARIGRPLTPGSVAGVHRRHHRRALFATDIMEAAAITLIATTAAITTIATMATITIIAATIITIIAIGETYRLVAASKLVIRVGQGPQHMLRPFPFPTRIGLDSLHERRARLRRDARH